MKAGKSITRRYSHTCTRCGFKWRGYRRKPARCGNRACGSPYWDRARKDVAGEQSAEVESGRSDNESLSWSLRSEEPRTCEVHGLALQPGRAQIAYGLFRNDESYWSDRKYLFPNSYTSVGGGCVSMGIGLAEVDFCPECREAETVWYQVRKLLSEPT